jgi:hypothetical protein
MDDNNRSAGPAVMPTGRASGGRGTATPNPSQRSARCATPSAASVSAGIRASVSAHAAPASPESGIRFRRSDRRGPPPSGRAGKPGRGEHAFHPRRWRGDADRGIEHVVAALAMTGIDNALIEVSGRSFPPWTAVPSPSSSHRMRGRRRAGRAPPALPIAGSGRTPPWQCRRQPGTGHHATPDQRHLRHPGVGPWAGPARGRPDP